MNDFYVGNNAVSVFVMSKRRGIVVRMGAIISNFKKARSFVKALNETRRIK